MPCLREKLKRKAFVFFLALSCALSGLTPQPVVALSAEAVWNQFAQAMSIEQSDFTWKKSYPEALSDGMELQVTGFIVPIQAQAYFTTFLMVDDPQNCPFCGSGAGYGPVLEVELKRPMPETVEFKPITVSGRLEFIDDEYTSQLFRLVEARVVD